MSNYKQELTTYKKSMGISNILENSNATPFRWSTIQASLQCFCCFQPFLTMTLLREHARKHTVRQLRLTLHGEPSRNCRLIKVDIKCLRCSLCFLSLNDLHSLKSHLSVVHGRPCDVGRNDILMPFVLEDSGYGCQLCSRTFSGFHALNQHMNVHFQNHVCDTCGAGFATSPRLRRHVASHGSGDVVLRCEPCDLVFATRYKLEMHKRQYHDMKYRHKCPRCPERFKDHYLRTNHLTTVHGVPAVRHSCALCDKVFARRGPLNAHVRQVHLKVKNHACAVCGQKFFQKSHLSKHMVSHSGEKNFHCEMCGKSYTLKNSLMHHVRMQHHNDKFKCVLCEQQFPDGVKFREHVRNHAPESSDTDSYVVH